MTENQLCSCCLSEECENSMSIVYLNVEKEEMYAKMLQNTFGINISGYICKECITKLRQAVQFKQQIIIAQHNIKQMNNADAKMSLDVEMENEVDHLSDSGFMWDGKQYQTDEDYVIKSESKTISVKNIASENLLKEVPNLSSIKSKKVLTGARCKQPLTKNVNYQKKSVKDKQKTSDLEYDSSPVTQTEKNARENSLKLIIHSNLCLFRSHKTKFGCFLCNNTYVEASKLREHSATHTNTKLLEFRINRWRGLSYKNADISDLQCKKCTKNVKNLSDLMTHLTEKHDVLFSGTDIYLIPYKLIHGNQCIICEKKFNSFLRLSIHMNTHSTNNVCEICGLSFINRLSLRTHVKSMHKEKKCPQCPAKFLRDSKKVAHLKKVHKIFNMKRYCNLCEKTFRYTYLLVKHKIEEHGAKKTVVNCVDCGKTFLCKYNLRTHVRSVHKKERNYPCDICGTRFFTKTDQKRHEKTHNDVKSFSCTYCDVKFKSRDSCRRHMKRQHGHVFT